MTPIPPKIRKKIGDDLYYKICAIVDDDCMGRIQFHHVWIYRGKQIQEVFAILPVCEHHHDMVKKSREIKGILELVSLQRATKEELGRYPNKDWRQITNYLNKKFP